MSQSLSSSVSSTFVAIGHWPGMIYDGLLPLLGTCHSSSHLQLVPQFITSDSKTQLVKQWSSSVIEAI